MNVVQSSGKKRSAADRFQARNDDFFVRRKELQARIAGLRARVGADERDVTSEVALRRAERELDDLTYEIMTANCGLVRRYVAAFASRSTGHSEDFESAGNVGLLCAISSYDPDRGPFANWAFKPIQREVLRAVRDADHPNLNLGDFEKRPIVLAAKQAFLEEFGAEAALDHADIARRAGLTEAQVRRVLEAPRLDSLQASAVVQSEGMIALEEQVADLSLSPEDEVLLHSQLRTLVDRGWPTLDTRERYVLTRRFGLDNMPEQSFRVIGEQIGLSREGVRKIHQKALAKLSGPIADAS
ncbi:sigma-70 family RNA polymerase sigma factor [Actinoallomurus sp. NBC_01490]|uniref:sigma-70 family RNA polymerase sigma factor n=1 Tax=Actinoallomurus sp. NBC_01490 TaxID=2903557 RepID=UPI002E362698|nr:sigma-70 family RNA polymerase sigma factor [Actinoallomurus sp. NBC_01490]